MKLLPESADLKFIHLTVIDIAKKSTCKRSKCGAIIVTPDLVKIGEGYNSMPCDATGDCVKWGLPSDFKSDKTCCVHAEQRAIMDALKGPMRDHLAGSSLFFIRLDLNDVPLHAGKPYCTICSKMALDSGIAKFMLWHKDGWTEYNTLEYNDLSFKYREE